jgi:uncharacterized membrane-anchored protein
MHIPTTTKFAAIVAFQLALVLGLVGYKQYTLVTGERILLKTTPVDPRDLFRGEYVALRYEISHLDHRNYDAGDFPKEVRAGDTVYVTLTKRGRFWDAERVSTTPPTDGRLFVRGTVSSVQGGAIGIRYGIESYFVPEGEGRELERAGGQGLVVEVSVDRSGRSVIRRAFVEGKR